MSNWNCSMCGNCCSNFLPLTSLEINKLKRLAKKENILSVRNDWYSRCPFLNNQNKCDIYEDRPLICREFTCYKFENHIYNTKEFSNHNFKDFIFTDIRKEVFNRNDNKDTLAM